MTISSFILASERSGVQSVGVIPPAVTQSTPVEGLGVLISKNTNNILLPSGIPLSVVFGSPIVTALVQTLFPSGLVASVVFGTPGYSQTVTPSGIPSTTALGSPSLTSLTQILLPSGISPLVVFGSPSTFLLNQIVLTIGIPSSVAFGIPNNPYSSLTPQNVILASERSGWSSPQFIVPTDGKLHAVEKFGFVTLPFVQRTSTLHSVFFRGVF